MKMLLINEMGREFLNLRVFAVKKSSDQQLKVSGDER
jgi:hypothetical protein